ncbi:hypothetical protein K2173_028206 [Erythroxylum novogranatense]|uniref:Uncharacterized protein n=1 Tax=Erythroxylum novogranatense TaxID=1862640 RepID=A0AAV8U470_9ROSI|nr:hypothetical protein K2173_028206 [Erythroxylum novogranatense]
MLRIRRKALLKVEEALKFSNQLLAEKPFLPFLIPLVFVVWCIERWLFTFSNWVPLVVAVWATVQYYSYQRQILVEDLNKKWKRVVLSTSPITPVEHCEWLNKLFLEVWLNYFNPKFSKRFSSMVEKRLRQNKSKLIEKVELLEFSLGSCPPSLGLQGTSWSTLGDQQIMRLGFDWDTSDMSIMLLAKLAKPFKGTARIVINSLHIKGDLLLMPALEGRAILYSFVSTPEVRIGIAFGSGGSQSLPATELPGVSSWLVKIATETLVKTMVEPRRRCFSLPAVDLGKKAVGGIIHVSVISASKLSGNSFKGSPSKKLYYRNGSLEEKFGNKDLHTFVEVELGQLTRRTDAIPGLNPRYDSTFNMVLHEDTGILRFQLYVFTPGSVKYDFVGSCEIKIKYVADDSSMFWALGPDFGVIAARAEFCGKEVEMVVPLEGVDSGELRVKLVLKEWQFSDGTISVNKFHGSSQQPAYGPSNHLLKTGRKINLVVVEGRDLTTKERTGKCDPYVKWQYGKVLQRTKTAHASNPAWNQKFEFDEVGGGECLMIKCYNEEIFGDDNIGSARVNMEGLVDSVTRDIWVPLEKVNSGEVRLQIEAVRIGNSEGTKGSGADSNNGWIELVIIEAKDLIAADIRGTSDPYVKVQYGNLKKRTKVVYKTLNPQWNQTLEFPDDGSPLELHVKDHNALLPAASIGDCAVEYQRLPPNQMFDKWIPLGGVKGGEIHIQITRKVPEWEKRTSLDSEASLTKSHQLSSQIKEMINNLQSLADDSDEEELSASLSELESLQDMQEDYMVQLETEQKLLIKKIKELGQEIMNSTPNWSRRSYSGIGAVI